jgi:F-type H+-transporting ATPase subunit a
VLSLLSFSANALTHPLEQFEIYAMFLYFPNYKGMAHNPSIITNLALTCALTSVILHELLSLSKNSVKINGLTLILKGIYLLVSSIIKSNLSLKRKQYFSTLFFLFLFILIANMLGLIPYTFTITSSFIITFFLALSHFIGINIIGFYENKWKSVKILIPSGVPLVIAPFLTGIEFISYIAKVFSLSIRLFANMMSGHALLKILIGFSWNLLMAGSIFIVISLLPWIVVTAIMFLEFLIAFLQAYVFTMLITIYINDVLVAH